MELLRDGNIETYWQSDGSQPHLISVQFQRKVRLAELALYTDFRKDESYTPSKISVRAGNSYSDLKEVKVVELNEPKGWVIISLTNGETNARSYLMPLRCHMLQIAVIANHQNGRDTHVRQVKIYGPREYVAFPFSDPRFVLQRPERETYSYAQTMCACSEMNASHTTEMTVHR